MKKLLSAIFFLLPYPLVLGWHFLLGATILWACLGAPREYSFWLVLAGGAGGIALGYAVYRWVRSSIVPALAILLLAACATACAKKPTDSAKWEQLTEMPATWENDSTAWSVR
ncbi:hypothetical protein DNI29_04540 [Hymenobacter sediminis]|uniref:hypothetical protein n=1 Tax=Hymenobacter sediminis TaxID=2218621 RepID=UPI000DA6C7C6|nr:hypothetical protein [Hymenobacter sediminis]RPD50071.1 hypothetical protein DNI29_04540 [Hymenobacter sediminis]